MNDTLLLLVDRGFYRGALWQIAAATETALLWRMPPRIGLPCLERYANGSYRSQVYPDPARCRLSGGIPTRIVEYTLATLDTARVAHLCITLVDPAAAPAPDLARLYQERWAIEQVFDELQTHQRGRQMVLRNKTPAGVLQDAYGYQLTHYAIRRLMSDASHQADTDANRLSCTHTVHVVRRHLSGPLHCFP